MALRSAWLTALAVLSLAACGGAGGGESAEAPTAVDAASAVAPASGPGAVILAGEGIRVTGAGEPRMIPFGAPREEAVAALSDALDSQPAEAANPGCPNGPSIDLQWPSGLQIVTQNDQFVGWRIEQDDLATASGIRVGSTRAQAQAAPDFAMQPNNYDQVMFTADGVTGVLASEEPKAAVTQLYAGYTCIAG